MLFYSHPKWDIHLQSTQVCICNQQNKDVSANTRQPYLQDCHVWISHSAPSSALQRCCLWHTHHVVADSLKRALNCNVVCNATKQPQISHAIGPSNGIWAAACNVAVSAWKCCGIIWICENIDGSCECGVAGADVHVSAGKGRVSVNYLWACMPNQAGWSATHCWYWYAALSDRDADSAAETSLLYVSSGRWLVARLGKQQCVTAVCCVTDTLYVHHYWAVWSSLLALYESSLLGCMVIIIGLWMSHQDVHGHHHRAVDESPALPAAITFGQGCV